MKFHFAICAALLFVVSNVNSAFAQNITANEEAPIEIPQWRELLLANADPDKISWDLDPLHNKSPRNMSFGKVKAAWRNPPALPEGVKSVVGVSNPHSLLVLSTIKGLQDLQKVVDPLDQPARMIDVRVSLITIDALTLASLQLDPQSDSAVEPNQAYVTLRVPANKREKLDALIQQGKAQENPLNNYPFSPRYKEGSGPMVTSTKVGPEIDSSVSQTLRQALRDSHVDGDPKIAFYRGTSFSMKPTINADETISLEVSFSRDMGLKSVNSADLGLAATDQKPEKNIVLQTRDVFAGIVKMKSGETVALLRSNVYAPTDSKEAAASTEFLLLSARIPLPDDELILYTNQSIESIANAN